MSEKTYHTVIELPVCFKCDVTMQTGVLETPEGENVPVYYCGPCKRVHKVRHDERVDWLLCCKLESRHRQFERCSEEGKVYSA